MKKKENKSLELSDAILICKLGRETLDNVSKPPENTTRQDAALYCLLDALESIAKFLMKKEDM